MTRSFTNPRVSSSQQNNRKGFLIIVTLLLLLGLVLKLCLALPLAQAQASRRVIVFLWDGTQRNHFLEAYNDNELPRVQALVNDGGLLRADMVIHTQNCVAGDGDGYDTETGPANSAIVTGYGFPEMANQDNMSPNPIPTGYTFFERVKVAYPEAKTGLLSSKDFRFWPTRPLSNAKPTIDQWFQDRVQNSVVADEAIDFLRTYGAYPFFLYVHFRMPDEAGHSRGENSQAYHNQVLDCDAQTGRVLDELASLGLDDDTVVLVTTDHGFTEGGMGHEACIPDNKDVWIASNRAHVINNSGVPCYQTAIGPTLFDILGMDKNVTPPFPSQSLWTAPGPPPDTPTPSSTPTETPMPTGTPVPTDTPMPTDTPTPTATPEPGTEIIIDNADPEFSVVGFWIRRRSPTAYASGFQYARAGTGADVATFAPDLPVSGDYEVFGWWPQCRICADNAPYVINHADGTTVVRVDQTMSDSGGQWVSLGVARFDAGTGGTVQVTNDADRAVAADAVRFVWVP